MAPAGEEVGGVPPPQALSLSEVITVPPPPPLITEMPFPGLGSQPNTANLLCSLFPVNAQQQTGTGAHRGHLPDLLKSRNSPISVIK